MAMPPPRQDERTLPRYKRLCLVACRISVNHALALYEHLDGGPRRHYPRLAALLAPVQVAERAVYLAFADPPAQEAAMAAFVKAVRQARVEARRYLGLVRGEEAACEA